LVNIASGQLFQVEEIRRKISSADGVSPDHERRVESEQNQSEFGGIDVESPPRQASGAASLLREPLVHFLALGAALFVVFGLIGKTIPNTPAKPKIEVTPERVEQLINYFKVDFKKDPSPQDVKKLVEDYVREEVLVRQAWADGVGREDPTVRLQLRKMMDLSHADTADMSPPTDEQIKAFAEAHPELLKGRTIEQSRATLASAVVADRRRQAQDAAYERLKAQYVIVIDPKALPSTTAPSTAEASKP
jgi:hypothetical protein